MKTIKFPSKGTVFDYFVQDARLEEWASIVETYDYSSEIPMNQVQVYMCVLGRCIVNRVYMKRSYELLRQDIVEEYVRIVGKTDGQFRFA